MATASTFTLPTFTDKQLSEPAFSRARINDLADLVQQRDTFIAARDNEITQVNTSLVKLQAQTDVLKSTLAERDTALDAGKKQIAELLAVRDGLQRQLDALAVARPKIAVGDLMQQFRGSIETINNEALKTGKPVMLVDNLQVEIKGGIDVSDGIRITQLPDSALGVESVSTLRFNLKPSTAIRMVDDDEPPAPQ